MAGPITGRRRIVTSGSGGGGGGGDPVDPTGPIAMSDVTGLVAALGTKVNRVPGKGLSTEDFTTPLKNKLDNLGPTQWSANEW